MTHFQIIANNLSLLVSTLLGAVVGGGVTYWVNSHLNAKESTAQAQAARMSLCVALRADAELCHRLAEDFQRSLPQIHIPAGLETHILTGRDLLLPVIQSRMKVAKNDLSDMDIQKIVAALRALTATVTLAETSSDTAFLLPAILQGAQGACCVALEALGGKTEGFRMEDVPHHICPQPLRGTASIHQCPGA